MGKEQDLLVAVKTGDLLLTHKLLSKVKCNKTSEYGAARGEGRSWWGGSSLVYIELFVWTIC